MMTKSLFIFVLKSQQGQNRLISANIVAPESDRALRRRQYFTLGRLREAAVEAKKAMNLTPEEAETIDDVLSIALGETLGYNLGNCGENALNGMINFFNFLKKNPQFIGLANKYDTYIVMDRVSDHAYCLILPKGHRIYSTNSPNEKPNFEGVKYLTYGFKKVAAPLEPLRRWNNPEIIL